jgi:hypothetical protein
MPSFLGARIVGQLQEKRECRALFFAGDGGSAVVAHTRNESKNPIEIIMAGAAGRISIG